MGKRTVPPLETRFWAKVNKAGSVHPELGQCWEWTGAKLRRGYGQIAERRGKPWQTHRLAWTLCVGPIPPGMFVCHRCNNVACCRPGHLFLGTHKDNMRDMLVKGRAAKGEYNGSRAKIERMPRGASHYISKLDNEKVWELLYLVSMGQSPSSVARRFGVNPSVVSAVVRNKTWKHVGRQSE